MTTYAEKLKDPRWQRKRLEAMEYYGFHCYQCGADDKTLHVHHHFYERGLAPWDYSVETLRILCEDCHAKESSVKRTFDLAMQGYLLNHGDLDLLTGYMRVQAESKEVPENCAQLEGAADALHITVEEAYEKLVHPSKSKEAV